VVVMTDVWRTIHCEWIWDMQDVPGTMFGVLFIAITAHISAWQLQMPLSTD
jgi:hypothetical protein